MPRGFPARIDDNENENRSCLAVSPRGIIIMRKLNRIILLLSTIFCAVCLILSIYVAVTLRDTFSYAMIVIFFLAFVWLGGNTLRSRKTE